MAVQSPYATTGNPQVVSGVAGNPNLVQLTDTQPSNLEVGHQGDLLTGKLHGDRYNAGIRSNLFWGSSGTGGAKLLAPGGTTAGFILYNPATSNKYLEVHRFKFSGASTETDVISGLGFECSVQAPSGTLTGATIATMPLTTIPVAVASSTVAVAKVYLAATITAMTYLGGMGYTIQATTSPAMPGIVEMGGELIIGPGMAVNLVSQITQGSDFMVVDVIWSEHYL